MTRLLLDTHALLWWLADESMAEAADTAIADPHNEVFVSAASIWEATIKQALDKLDVVSSLAKAAEASGFTPLSVDATHAEMVATLPDLHRDPFDRMLVAQATVESLTIVSRDRRIAAYNVATLVC